MNKNNGILFLALAALAYGAWQMFGNRPTAKVSTGTTGTMALAPLTSFAQGASVKGGRNPAGAASGASIDLGPAVTAGINALANLAKSALDKWAGAGAARTEGTSPGTTTEPDWTPGYEGSAPFIPAIWQSAPQFPSGAYKDPYENWTPPDTSGYDEPGSYDSAWEDSSGGGGYDGDLI